MTMPPWSTLCMIDCECPGCSIERGTFSLGQLNEQSLINTAHYYSQSVFYIHPAGQPAVDYWADAWAPPSHGGLS